MAWLPADREEDMTANAGWMMAADDRDMAAEDRDARAAAHDLASDARDERAIHRD